MVNKLSINVLFSQKSKLAEFLATIRKKLKILDFA